MFPFAPGRFSTTTCWPSRGESRDAMARATRSLAPPGGNPTRKRTGFTGYASAACAAEADNMDATTKTMLCAILTLLPVFRHRNIPHPSSLQVPPMSTITLQQAEAIIDAVLTRGRELSCRPLSVVVTDPGAHATA